MNRTLFIAASAVALCLLVTLPASAQVQLLNIHQDVPVAATLDNPCTSAIEAIAFTGTTHLDQQVWLMPGGTTRLAVADSTLIQGTDALVPPLIGSPTYTGSGSDAVDAEFNPGAATIYNYKQVTNSANSGVFYVIVQVDFDPGTLQLNVSLSASCDDGSPVVP